MNFIIDILKEFVILADIEIRKILAIVDRDFGLIRYITKITSQYIFDTNKSGYVQVPNRQEGQTLLHRIILEYYSQFDVKLFTVLNNENYEVNHKNKLVWDNRLENLEIVTQKGNLLHEHNKDYSSEIVMTTEELIKIREERKTTDEYRKDKLYIDRAGRKNNNILKNKSGFQDLFRTLYLRFSNGIVCEADIAHNLTNTINREKLEHILFYYKKSHILYKYIENELINNSSSSNIAKYINSFISNIVSEYKIFYVTNVLNNNIKLLFDQLKRKNLLKVYNKYKIYNLDLEQTHNLLPTLFLDIKRELAQFTIYKNEILLAYKVCNLSGYKKYDTFRVIYLLGLLKRLPKPKESLNWFNNLRIDQKNYYKYFQQLNPFSYRKRSNTPSFFKIPRWTEQTFIEASKRATTLLEADLHTISHFTIQTIFGEKIADEVFQNPKCKINTARATRTNQDINNIILSFRDQAQKEGFILLEEIFEELEYLNYQRKMNEEPYNEISNKCIKFIRTCLHDIPETKDILKQLRIRIYIFRKRHYKQHYQTQTKERYYLLITVYIKTTN